MDAAAGNALRAVPDRAAAAHVRSGVRKSLAHARCICGFVASNPKTKKKQKIKLRKIAIHGFQRKPWDHRQTTVSFGLHPDAPTRNVNRPPNKNLYSPASMSERGSS